MDELKNVEKQTDLKEKSEVKEIPWKGKKKKFQSIYIFCLHYNYFLEKTRNQKIKSVLFLIIKIVILLICLYFFMVTLELMTDGFRLILGHNASEIFKNPILNLN